MQSLIFVLIILSLLLLVLIYRANDTPTDGTPDTTSNLDKRPQKNSALSQELLKEKIPTLPKVKVKYVVDGDTAIILKGWSKVTVRLDAIDCPEDGQYWGDTAKFGLIKLVANKYVHIEEHGYDKYGRTIATMFLWHHDKNEWMNVNERMVTLGHAWVMRMLYDHLPADRKEKLNQLERWAKSKKIGLWKEPNPTPPWEWRKSDKVL